MMTRIGVMKHLRVLEEARLVATKRRGREKLHFLNPVPIRLVHDRWGEQVRGAPWAATLTGLRGRLRRSRWKRCSRSTSRRRPSGCGRRSPIPTCARSSTVRPAGRVGLHARVAVRGRASVDAGHVRRRGEPRGRPAAAPQRTSMPLERRREGRGDVTRHLGDRARRRLPPARRHARPAARGRERRGLRRLADDLSGLKTLLETGETLTTPGSLHYVEAS